jgi:hypothetical protein
VVFVNQKIKIKRELFFDKIMDTLQAEDIPELVAMILLGLQLKTSVQNLSDYGT